MSGVARKKRFSAAVKFVNVGVSRTKQSFKKDCDINVILRQFIKSGSVNHLAKYGGEFGNVDPLTFHESMNVVAKAKEMFMDLPSGLRKRFNNEPSEFLKFAQDEKNIGELRVLGLAKPAAAAPVAPVVARMAELEVDAAARLEIARRAIVAPPAPSTVGT